MGVLCERVVHKDLSGLEAPTRLSLSFAPANGCVAISAHAICSRSFRAVRDGENRGRSKAHGYRTALFCVMRPGADSTGEEKAHARQHRLMALQHTCATFTHKGNRYVGRRFHVEPTDSKRVYVVWRPDTSLVASSYIQGISQRIQVVPPWN